MRLLASLVLFLVALVQGRVQAAGIRSEGEQEAACSPRVTCGGLVLGRWWNGIS